MSKARQVEKGLLGGIVDRYGHSHVRHGKDNNTPTRVRRDTVMPETIEKFNRMFFDPAEWGRGIWEKINRSIHNKKETE